MSKLLKIAMASALVLGLSATSMTGRFKRSL